MSLYTPVPRLPTWLSRRHWGMYGSPRYMQKSFSSNQVQNPLYPLYPSVSQLLHERAIPKSDISKIPASGPNGRLLKGDVLAYVGAIAPDYSSTLSAQLSELAQLDLNNIKLAVPSKTPSGSQEQKEPRATTPAPIAETEIAVPISLSTVLSIQKRIRKILGITIPLATFLARATDFANDDLPLSKSTLRSTDVLFDEILGLRDASNPVKSRGNFIPQINPVAEDAAPAPMKAHLNETDIIDILSGKVSPNKPGRSPKIESLSDMPTSEDIAVNVFSLKVPVGDKLRGKVFLERLKTFLQDEPEKLIF